MILEVALEKRLGDFSFAAEFFIKGQRLGVFGPSGSGKSTLMNLLAGLLPADRGMLRLDGAVLFDSARRINLPPERRRIGVVFQHAHLFPHLNVRRNLLYGYQRVPRAERSLDPESICRALNLDGLLERNAMTLSGGERQRVALGRTLLACPRLILMDEPLTGLDAGLKYQIIPYLQKVFAEFGIPLVFISHSLNEMRLMTDEVLVFNHGGLTAQVSAEELARQRMATSQVGYINLLTLKDPRQHDGLWRYRWDGGEMMIADGSESPEGVFELSSKDITLFKRHPEASSARNMLRCRVREVFAAGNRIGVELDCSGGTLVSQVVRDAVGDLELAPDREVVAVIKASAFRRLY